MYIIYFIVATCFDLICHLQAINIKLIKVFYAIVLDGINTWDLNFTIKLLHVAILDPVLLV
jgi:hypothetical protein